MVDWQDYAYTMVFTKDGVEQELSSDSIIYLIQMGSAGLETGLYTSATIYSNKGASHERT